MKTGEVRSAKPDDYILRHCSYPYPAKELTDIKAQEAALGVTCEEVLKEVNAWEMMPLNKGTDIYPEAIRNKLRKLVDNIPAFKFFALMHNSFTPKADPQTPSDAAVN